SNPPSAPVLLASTTSRGCRAGASIAALEVCQEFRVQRVEIVGDPDLAAVPAQLARTWRFRHRNQAGDRLAGARDHDLLSRRDPAQELGEMRLRLVDVDLGHDSLNLD